MQTFWFIAIALLWTGFLVLEGFDFGVGMLHGVVGRTDAERRLAINAIGPLWDGNEVWLIVAAAGIFAAFPGWLRAAQLGWLKRFSVTPIPRLEAELADIAARHGLRLTATPLHGGYAVLACLRRK